MKRYLAIDIGASSGRHMLGRMEDGRICLETVHRFDNKQVERNGHVCWDMQALWGGIMDGLIACKSAAPASIGIDTWGVDFVLLDGEDNVLGDAVAYRDSRTQGVPEAVEGLISARELYARTGIQRQLFNTIYQLMALKKESPELLSRAQTLLMMPDYFHFLLTGVKKQEYTNASTTGLVDCVKRDWDWELIDLMGLPRRIFGKLSMPGERVGKLRDEIAAQVGYQTTVVLPATHDTGSAYLAVPRQNENAVYLSSGTWSLLGVESDSPIATEDSRLENFTNEGGASGNTRFLKNIMGLWMIQSIRRELNGQAYVAGRESRYADGRQWSFADLISATREASGFTALVDVNSDGFLAPDSMIDAVRAACVRANQPVPETVGEIMCCVYHSLTVCYRDAIRGLSALTKKEYDCIHIVGGGCQDEYLNALTAQETGLTVHAGPIEATAVGNLLMQMLSDGVFDTPAQAREAVLNSFDVKTYHP